MAASRDIGTGGWSYFGDPRSVHHDGKTFTGWIDPRGKVVVGSIDRGTGATETTVLRDFLSVDDHNNPSLIVRPDGRILAFYSPHSGRERQRIPIRLYYRLSKRPGDIGEFGRERHLKTNTPGKLGYTYPNPVQLSGGRLWLFWRGGNWQPSFSTSTNGTRWSRARTLLRGPRGHRPYIKYEGDGRGTIHFAFNEAHPSARRTSLYYAYYRAGRFYRADGSRIGSMRSLPLRPGRTDRVYAHRRAEGSAWVNDIAVDHQNRPVIVYSRRPHGSVFHYARWNGSRWEDHALVPCGGSLGGYGSQGITVDHEAPHIVYLSREVDGVHEVEIWVTADGGETWASRAITRQSPASNIRPVSPRGLVEGHAVLWMGGDYLNYKRYDTSIVASLEQEAKRKAKAARSEGG